jgi:hypothetical protein
MRTTWKALLTLGIIGAAMLAAWPAEAQWRGGYGPYGYGPGAYCPYAYGGYGPRTYAYGANRANPSLGVPWYDLDNPRDFQLQGHL